MAPTDLKPFVEKEGQAYVDEYAKPEDARHVSMVRPKRLSQALRLAFGAAPLKDEVVSFNRIPLRWMKQDGKGGLVPR